MRGDHAERLRRNALRRDRLMKLLIEWPKDKPLARMADLGRMIGASPAALAYIVCGDLDTLATQRRLQTASGTWSVNRGHRIVRLPSGRVLKTEPCALVLPP